ncbi:helicase HerA domain-containing protein [Archaeoglobus neptunius]|uniref:helicase HerA domain-containing protein n=1 Tax=Archaeoglobus neptunius TaxID=2798580 RepID=UPI0019267067|nr:ATP-binding protein [Archaeoglobus neptunius]
MKGAVGKIYGEASSFEFNFVVFNQKQVKRGDYVKVWNDVDGWVVAYVEDIVARSNVRNREIKEIVNGSNEVFIAKAVVLGKREDGRLRVPRSPFVPGESVFLAEEKLIAEVLGLSNEGVYIGLLGDTGVKVKLNPNSLVQKHVCILAKTGSGKSYTAGVIIEELLDHNVPLLIVDPHGEYRSMKYPNEQISGEFGIKPKAYADKIRIIVPPISPFTDRADGVLVLDGVNLSAEELIELTGLKNPTAQALLYQALKELKGDDYTIADIIEEVEKIRHNGKWTLLGALTKVEESGLFGDRPTDLSKLLQRGKATILDLRGVEPSFQDLIVSRICTKLFELRKLGKVEPGMIVIEEAHNFIPERGFDRAVSTGILRTIASEGRKFGLGLMVISQRPARVDKNVISQCNTQIILRVTNPNDINAIKNGVEGITAEMVEEIKRLPPGNAMIVSPELERPVIVRVRCRKSMHGEAVNVTESKREVKKKKREKKQEKKGFLRRLFG